MNVALPHPFEQRADEFRLFIESLRRAGIPNKVVALRNGTMGWELAGLRCDRGRTDRYAPGTPKTADLALQRAKAFAENSQNRVPPPAR